MVWQVTSDENSTKHQMGSKWTVQLMEFTNVTKYKKNDNYNIVLKNTQNFYG